MIKVARPGNQWAWIDLSFVVIIDSSDAVDEWVVTLATGRSMIITQDAAEEIIKKKNLKVWSTR